MTAPSSLRTSNVAAVVEALRLHGSISRTDVARATGLSRTTVLSILDDLEQAGFITVRGDDGSFERRLGRPAARVALHPSAGVALGVVVGRDELHLVVADLSLAVRAERRARYGRRPPPERLTAVVVDLAEEALAESGVARPLLVGAAVGLPSPVHPDTEEVDTALLDGWSAPEVRARLAERLGTPVRLENDANVEALAELVLGAGRGLRHVIYVHAGFSLGGAVVLDGALWRGRSGTAGEFAHVAVAGAGGPQCGCGRRDCLSSVAAGWALLDAMTVARDGELDLDGLVALARSGDAGARRALTDAGEAIGTVAAALCGGLNPEAVIIGGKLGFAASPLVEAAARRLDEAVHRAAQGVRVLPAALGDTGGPLGAAAVVARSGDVFPDRVALA